MLFWLASRVVPVIPLLEHQDSVRSAAFSPDGTRVVTASRDGTARMWILPIDMGSLEDWRLLARCSPFALVDGVLTTSPEPTQGVPAAPGPSCVAEHKGQSPFRGTITPYDNVRRVGIEADRDMEPPRRAAGAR
jgi:hypothetical protein